MPFGSWKGSHICLDHTYMTMNGGLENVFVGVFSLGLSRPGLKEALKCGCLCMLGEYKPSQVGEN